MKAATIAFAAAAVLAGPALGQGAPNDAQIAHIVVSANQVDIDAGKPVSKMAEKPSNPVTTPAEPRQFGRDSVYATQPPNPSNPLLAGGATVDEAGGSPVYAAQFTHPSGPVMEAGNDLQPYGRDSVYMAGSPNAAPPLYFDGRQQSRI